MVHVPPYLGNQLHVTAGVETAAVEMETLADDEDVDAVEDNHHLCNKIVKKAHSDEHPHYTGWDGSALCTPVQDTQLGPCSSYDWSW